MNLSEKEYNELLALEYVLTWDYTDDFIGDTSRYLELSEKKDKDILNIEKSSVYLHIN